MRRPRGDRHRNHLGHFIRGVDASYPRTGDEDDSGGVTPHAGLKSKPVGSGVIAYRKPPFIDTRRAAKEIE